MPGNRKVGSRSAEGLGKVLHELRVQLRKEARKRGDEAAVRHLNTAITAHATARDLYARQNAGRSY